MFERAQNNLAVILDQPQDAQEYAKKLIKIAENCTTNLTIQQYVFTRIEEILGLGMDANDSDIDAYGTKHVHLFTNDGKTLADNCFARAITFSDIYLQRSASLTFACLLTVCEGNLPALVNWINTKFSSTSNGVWDMALPALSMISRSESARAYLVKAGIVSTVVGILKRIGVNGNSQHIYELIFTLWSLSLTQTNPEPYLHAGAVPILLEVLAAAPSKKVTRIIIFTLKNLAVIENENLLNEMYSAGILRLLEYLANSQSIKQLADVDVDADFQKLQEVLAKNYRELSKFDRLSSEIKSGALR